MRAEPIGRVGKVAGEQRDLRARLLAHFVEAAVLVRRNLVFVAQGENEPILGEARFLVTEKLD